MNTESWSLNAFESPKYKIPQHWRCPQCEGALVLESKQILKAASYESRKRNEPFQNDYRFAALLRCLNCEECVTVNGEAYDHEDYVDDEQGQTQIVNCVQFVPKFFHPSLHIFPVLPKIRKSKIYLPLDAAFGHFFNDTSAAANRIRTFVEVLLTEWYIPKTKRKDKKTTVLTTHARIELFKAQRPDVADLIMAIKWIGNDGSHDGIELTQHELLIGFDLVEHILKELYDDGRKRAKANAKYINKRKGLALKKKTKS